MLCHSHGYSGANHASYYQRRQNLSGSSSSEYQAISISKIGLLGRALEDCFFGQTFCFGNGHSSCTVHMHIKMRPALGLKGLIVEHVSLRDAIPPPITSKGKI